MADVEVRDVLLRIGGRTLHRTGYLCAMGAGRGYVEVKETFTRADATTCATFIDRDVGAGQLLRTAAANLVRIEYPPALSGLVDQFGYPYCGPSLEGSRANSWTKARKVEDAVWTKANLTPTANNAAGPWGTVTASKLTEDAVNNHHYIERTFVGATDNQPQCFTIQVKPNGRQWLRILTLDKAGGVANSWVDIINRVAGTVGGTHQVFTPRLLANGFVRIQFKLTTVASGATTPLIDVVSAPADGQSTTILGDGVTGWFVEGIHWEKDAAFPGSFIDTDAATVTRTSDSLVLPVNWGPIDCTGLVRLARPIHADASGDIGLFPQMFGLGTRAGGGTFQGFFQKTSRNMSSEFWWSVANSTSKLWGSVPAGNEIITGFQLKNPKTAPQVTLDADGTGMLAFSGAGTPIAAWGTQTIGIGGDPGAAAGLYSVVLDLIVARGLRTRAEMLAIP